MKNIIIAIIGIGIVVVAGVALLGASDRSGETKTEASAFDTFASIPLATYNGKAVSLEEFRGKPLVINSWAVWCPFCREELPDFAALQKEFGDQIIVIAIDRRETLAKAKGYTDELNITNEMMFLLDSSDSFYASIGGFSMPETLFVNGSGDIVVHKRGPMDLNEMREHANKIINNNESL